MATVLRPFRVTVAPPGTSHRRSRVVLARSRGYAEKMVTRYSGDHLTVGAPNPLDSAFAVLRLSRPPRPRELRDFYRELASALAQSPGVVDALRSTLPTVSNGKLADAIVTALDDKTRADGVPTMLGCFRGVLPYEHVERMIAAGADLPQVVLFLAASAEKGVKITGEITQALIMPAVTAMGALGAGIYMAKTMLPPMAGLFAQNKAALPLPTAFLMRLVELGEKFPPLFLIPPLLPIAAFWWVPWMYARSAPFQSLIDRLPVIGKLLEQARWSKVLRTLAMLLSSGKAAPEALEHAARSTSHKQTERFLRAVRQTIKSQACDLFEGCRAHLHLLGNEVPRWVDLLPLGVQHGTVPEQLEKSAADYESRSDFALKTLPKVMEIAGVALSGAIVGFVMAAVLFPSFRIGSILK